MKNHDSLGDRMKRYERACGRSLTPNMPVAIRVDGRAFHTWTKNLPDQGGAYSRSLCAIMDNTAYSVATQLGNFVIGYVQSDEITFILDDSREHNTQPWFGNDHSKIVSMTASMVTAEFNNIKNIFGVGDAPLAYFDSRAFSIPHREVLNCILWRMKDWERNSLQMFARQHFSHKKLHGKSRADQHEMLHSVGKNWATDVPARYRNGMLLLSKKYTSSEKNSIISDISTPPSYDALRGMMIGANEDFGNFYS